MSHPAAPSTQVLDELADTLRLVIGRLARRLRQQALDGLTPSQRSALASLERGGPLRVGELARLEGVTPPSISGIIDRLERRGLATRGEDQADARSTLVQATEEGRRVLAGSRRERTAFLTHRLARLDPSEMATLTEAVGLLDRIASEE